MSSFNEEKEAMSFVGRCLIWFFLLMMVVGAASWFSSRAVQTVDTGLVRYQEFQSIYNTTEKLKTDLCNLEAVDEGDKMFEQFSKAQRTNAIQANMNRWIAEYNAKSALINFNLWKSKDLPHRLELSTFTCKN
jgi:hypothetical protein